MFIVLLFIIKRYNLIYSNIKMVIKLKNYKFIKIVIIVIFNSKKSFYVILYFIIYNMVIF